ncbi:peptidoglycan DD-metalloendopeptidase family protein [Leucobacter sp. NPDC077196]|uniref:M23 family metallopeptidase n=1 Tax=Leucobacter sp. NPDC077196 TaxID=3154959 RepID=UPI00341FB18D
MAEIYWPFATSTVSEWPGTRGSGWADHVGTDFAIPQGTPLKATMAGTVDIHWTDGLGAWVIDIIAPDGTVVRNGHLSYMAVADGEWVNVGDYIGNTGGAGGTAGAGMSTGPHLHWEIRNNTGWGATGWYDPRNLTIKTFGQTAPPAKPQAAAPATKKRRRNKMDYACVTREKSKGTFVAMVFCLGNGEVHEFESTKAYVDNIAKTYQCGPTSIVTASHYSKIQGELAATRKRLDARKG